MKILNTKQRRRDVPISNVKRCFYLKNVIFTCNCCLSDLKKNCIFFLISEYNSTGEIFESCSRHKIKE